MNSLIPAVLLTRLPSRNRKWPARGILSTMHSSHIPWEAIIFGLLKLLKVFGLIPGAIAAFGVRRLYQRSRQKKLLAPAYR
jgi:hypothetical protein